VSKRRKRPEAYRWLTRSRDRIIYRGGWLTEDPHKASVEIVKALYKAGALRVECEPQNELTTDTLYVTINPKRITKELLELFVNLAPDEFDEWEPNVYRLWWD